MVGRRHPDGSFTSFRMTTRAVHQQASHSVCESQHPTGGLAGLNATRALLFIVGSELARAVCQSASKLADLRNTEFLRVPTSDGAPSAGVCCRMVYWQEGIVGNDCSIDSCDNTAKSLR